MNDAILQVVIGITVMVLGAAVVGLLAWWGKSNRWEVKLESSLESLRRHELECDKRHARHEGRLDRVEERQNDILSVCSELRNKNHL